MTPSSALRKLAEAMTATELQRSTDFAATSGMYELLSRLWLCEVDQEFIADLQGTELRDAFQATAGSIPCEDELEELATEYCRLFVGPKNHLPPLQSVWERGELQSEITPSIRAFAEAVRYQPPAEQANAMLDHLGVQLGIMSCSTELNSQSACEDSLEFAREFFRRHLSWTDELLSAAKERANHTFYQSLVQMTEEFLHEESAFWLR